MYHRLSVGIISSPKILSDGVTFKSKHKTYETAALKTLENIQKNVRSKEKCL